jgi:Holliday junction resolvase RusA-like endonuclease
MTAAELVVRVHGTPAPQGSKKAFIRGKRVVLVEMSDALPAWRSAVLAAAESAVLAASWLPLTDAVAADVTIWLPRPKTIRRPLPCVTPDVDKLARGCLDALTLAKVYADDALVVDLMVRKRYADDGRRTGATIRVAAISDQGALL